MGANISSEPAASIFVVVGQAAL